MWAIRGFGWLAARDPAGSLDAFYARNRQGAPFVVVPAARRDSELGETGLRREVLVEVLRGAQERKLPAMAIVDDWTQAADVVELGANAVYGLPGGPVPEALVERMRALNVAYAPALGLYLELNHLLGNERALNDPFLTATVQPAILDSYRSERGLFQVWRPYLDQGRARQASALQSLERLAEAGVRVVVASEGCWPGAFQGHSSHAVQAWLERAGLDGWTRLSAATLWPAQLLGRRLDFEPGQPADFLALDADPLQSAKNLQQISLVIRQGKLVDRQLLLPDLKRRSWQP
jgi:hypothetical protein